MKTSELIKQLQQNLEINGDLEVGTFQHGYDDMSEWICEVDKIIITPGHIVVLAGCFVVM